jgi:MerR family transcriptional regulator, copper efflux regulator
MSTARDADDCGAPIACSLDASAMPERLADWQSVLEHVGRREPLPLGVRLTFDPPAPVDDLARLAAAEQACCPFFAFAITIDGRGVALEVTAPTDGQDVVHALFG